MALVNAFLTDLLEVLARDLSEIEVASVRSADDVVLVDLRGLGLAPTLLCNAAAGPVHVGRRGRKYYGAYTLIGKRYGDWVKGETVAECVEYIRWWFNGRLVSAAGSWVNGDRVCLSFRRSSASGDRVDLDAVADEIAARSAWKVRPGHELVTPDEEESFTLCGDRGDVSGGSEHAVPLAISAATEGELTAAVLGFFDGLSELTDD